MPIMPTYPGVYVEELPSAVHNIIGVSTASTAFVDFFPQGPMSTPTLINNFTQFQTTFGGLDQRSEASYGIMQYFLNGGQNAWVVRVAAGSPAPSQVTLDDAETPTAKPTLLVEAASAGVWGNNLQVGIDTNTATTDTFNLVVRLVDSATKPTQVLQSEVYRNLSMTKASANYAIGVVNASSALIQLTDEGAGTIPNTSGSDVIAPIANPTSTVYMAVSTTADPASDGTAPDATALTKGIATLDHLDPFIFNILCVPGAATLVSGGTPDAVNIAKVYSYAASFCDTHRAMLIVDVPFSITTTSSTASNGILSWVNTLQTNSFPPDANSAIYFPTLQVSDPLNGGRLRNVGASGTLAGIWASTDSSRGVWKSPAGIDATVSGASLAVVLNDADSAAINPLGINALRNFKTYGNVVWGARTMQGADQQASQWKYISVRRTALYLEESLLEGLKWVVFEPNDTPLWSQIRLNVTSFLQNLFLQGAFQGTTPASAYFVKCDSETTTQADIDSGIVNIVVGFAPLQPAEFVILQIQQIAGQSGM